MSAYLELEGVLNQLAGTTGLGAAGAANVWAGTKNLELVAALNVKAGNLQGHLLEFEGVCTQLNGGKLSGVGALNQLAAVPPGPQVLSCSPSAISTPTSGKPLTVTGVGFTGMGYAQIYDISSNSYGIQNVVFVNDTTMTCKLNAFQPTGQYKIGVSQQTYLPYTISAAYLFTIS